CSAGELVRATQAWLQSSRHVQVPFAWLEACVEWIQGDTGGANHLSQQQINQQVLDQWLLTDLRDLGHPVLPEGLAQAQKTELNGTFCVQVDSLLDVSQPAYGQLQKWRGTDCTNDEVSAVTQTTQRPWEAKATRMLLLQITDGVQSLEAMEYQSIPALIAVNFLRPGAKLQLQGKMVCRLGVVLLGPSNVKMLGGEVEDLVERNTQGRVLCRTLGLPEPEQQNIFFAIFWKIIGLFVSFRSQTFSHFHRSDSTQPNRSGSVRRNEDDEDLVELFHSVVTDQNSQEDNMADDEFPDEDFPLDELDSVILQEGGNVDNDHRSTHQNNRILVNQSEQFGRARESNTSSSLSSMSPKTVTGTPQEKTHSLNAAEDDPSVPALTLTSAPFTYLCLLDKLLSKPRSQPTEVCVKAFIVTLLGKLTSSNGVWSVSASISDGTGYLDVELSNEVLTGLLGFSVAEKTALKRDPSRRGELDSGMRRCQEELVDMCCIMTIVAKPGDGRAVVAKAQPVSERVLRELEQRVRESKRS
uniref:RecQ-mediated genome instability protein 1 n=1 Tax=Poecilia reticulata TaxID=8081 RepID=A0A3P9Q245_POERE